MSTCEYYDRRIGQVRNRNYIVHLQQKVAELENQLKQTADLDPLDSEGPKAKGSELPAPASPSTTGDSRHLVNVFSSR
jgi:hypothetical protein